MNDIQEIMVSTHGAELMSIVANGREYLWQGDPAYWSRRAPILFPVVGKVAYDTLRINGNCYHMPQHGFARDAEFTPHHVKTSLLGGDIQITSAEGPLCYSLVQDGSFANYPYNFELKVSYSIFGNELSCGWEVKNLGANDMHFQIGAHPAFLLPGYDMNDHVHGYIQCYDEYGNTVNPVVKNSLNNGLRIPCIAHGVILDGKNFLALTDSTFDFGAIIIEDEQIASMALFDKNGRPLLTVFCPQAEAFGIWAPNKPGCPFVCIEPWCGIADRVDFNGDISERDCTHSLETGRSYLFSYSIQIH